jgi:hypothetical protein
MKRKAWRLMGKRVPFTLHLAGAALDVKRSVPFTGTKTAHGLLGFSRTGQITITQTVPLKLTLLGLEYRMSVGD